MLAFTSLVRVMALKNVKSAWTMHQTKELDSDNIKISS